MNKGARAQLYLYAANCLITQIQSAERLLSF